MIRSSGRPASGLLRSALTALAASAAFAGALALATSQTPPGELADVVDEADALDVAAENLAVDTESRKARFEGSVVARRGDWVMKCSALSATYSADGKVSEAIAEGPVELAGPDLYAEAKSARYDRLTETIVLEGDPSVRRGQSALDARSVTVHLESSKIEMVGVKGRFALPAKTQDQEKGDSEKSGPDAATEPDATGDGT